MWFCRETDADRKIREIMTRVMKHADTVLSDIDKQPQSPTIHEPEDKAEDKSQPEISVDASPQEVIYTVTDQAPSDPSTPEVILIIFIFIPVAV